MKCKINDYCCVYHACMSEDCQKKIILSQGHPGWGAGRCKTENNSLKKTIMKEKLIITFKSILIGHEIEEIVSAGYNKTGNKFSVIFNGSKGYLDNIEFVCEGKQKDGINYIHIDSIRNQKGLPINKMVSVYHSEENGVRIEVK